MPLEYASSRGSDHNRMVRDQTFSDEQLIAIAPRFSRAQAAQRSSSGTHGMDPDGARLSVDEGEDVESQSRSVDPAALSPTSSGDREVRRVRIDLDEGTVKDLLLSTTSNGPPQDPGAYAVGSGLARESSSLHQQDSFAVATAVCVSVAEEALSDASSTNCASAADRSHGSRHNPDSVSSKKTTSTTEEPALICGWPRNRALTILLVLSFVVIGAAAAGAVLASSNGNEADPPAVESSSSSSAEGPKFNLVGGSSLFGEEGSGYGKAVCLSSDGKTLAIAGDASVEIYRHVDSQGESWVLMGSTLMRPSGEKFENPEEEETKLFRVPTSVQLSGDGKAVAVGWPTSVMKNDIGEPAFVGCVGVYYFDTEKRDWTVLGGWLNAGHSDKEEEEEEEVTANSTSGNAALATSLTSSGELHFGSSVSLSDTGNTLAVAAAGGSECILSPDETGCGSVRVYQFEVGTWRLRGSPVLGDSIGKISINSVALSNSGVTLAVGGEADPENRGGGVVGRVYQFETFLGDWSEVGQGIKGKLGSTVYTLALSGDGTTVAISNQYTSASKVSDENNELLDARVFRWNSDRHYWTILGSSVHDKAGRKSGYFIDLSDDGETMVMGDPGRVGGAGVSGHAHLYKYVDGEDWEQFGADVNGTSTGDYFGYSVSISADGTQFAVGAPYSRALNTATGHGQVAVYQTVS